MSFRAIVVLRVAVDLDGDPPDRAKVDEAEEELREATRTRDRDRLGRVRARHEKAEARLLRERAGLAKQAERLARELTVEGGVVLDASVEVVEERS